MTDSELTSKELQGVREDLGRSSRDTNEGLDAIRAEGEAGRREFNQCALFRKRTFIYEGAP